MDDLVKSILEGRVVESAAFDQAIVRLEGMSTTGSSPFARVLYLRGLALMREQDFKAALRIFDEVMRRFVDSPDPSVRQDLAQALLEKGNCLDALGQAQEAFDAFTEVFTLYDAEGQEFGRGVVSNALFNMGGLLRRSGHLSEAAALFENSFTRSVAATDAERTERSTRALLERSLCLGLLGNQDGELEGYDAVIATLPEGEAAGAADSSWMANHCNSVARALYNKGISLAGSDRREDAIRTFKEVETRFGSSGEPGLREQVVRAAAERAVNLAQLERFGEAKRLCDEVIARFAESADPVIQVEMQRVLGIKAVIGGLD